MCYSAQVWQAYHRYMRVTGDVIDISLFIERYGFRGQGDKIKFARALDLAFLADPDAAVEPIRQAIRTWDAERTARLERELFTQRKRVADAERLLKSKDTKKAREDVRIGTRKVRDALRRLETLRRTEPLPADSRIFPGTYAPVLAVLDGKRALYPMRYQCRPAGKPAFYDSKYPGTYNARRDNLEGFWKGQFGHSHCVLVAERFYENVEGSDGRNQVLEFEPADREPMWIACLWSKWTDPKGKEPDLLSFAAITDEPPPEVAAAGHDRCIIPIKAEHVDAWLHPNPDDLAASYAILDDRHRPYYEHRLAA